MGKENLVQCRRDTLHTVPTLMLSRYGALLFLVTTVHCYSGDRYIDYSSDDETAGEDLTHLPEQQQLFGYNINQRRSVTTVTPTNAPTNTPTNAPTKAPSNVPTNAPSTAPTAAPTVPPWWTCITEGSNLPWSHNEIDTNLKSISINMGILVPRFDPGTHEYTVLFEAGTNHTGELLLWANLSSPCAYLNGSGYLNPAVPSPQVLKNYGPVWPTGPFQTRGLYRVVFDQERDTIFQVRVVDDRALPSGNASYTSYSIKIPAAAGADGLAVPVLPPGHSCQDRPSLGRTMQPGGMLDAGLGGWQSYVTREGRGRQGLEVHDDAF